MNSLSDMFTRIKNAYKAGHEAVLVPHSKLKVEVARVLKERGFIKDIEKKGKKVRKFLELTLEYKNGSPALSEVRSISKSSRRLYVKSGAIPAVRGGRGVLILSTSKGVMTGVQAKKEKVGGEMIAEVW